ncbi:MAG: hypothetical protein KGD70_02725 [Candidatus Lokiarchaeota archaeon]|jgi:formate dehydrogenase assembly factor FdhD|nr:hypothetical protein [Candidatus Lokiarchaeota archaeon]
MVEKQILKLSKLCEHWAAHNDSHRESYIKWRDIAKENGLDSVVEKLNKAIEMMEKSTDFLLSARKDLEM